MPAKLDKVFGRNITLVYNVLDLKQIDRNKLRDLISDINPAIMDTPEMIVAIFPPNPPIIQLGDNRIRISIPSEIEGLGDFPLWELAHKSHKLVKSDKSLLIAYGYNYDFGIILSDQSANNYLRSKFIVNQGHLESILEGNLVSFSPRIVYKDEKTQYDLIFEPLENLGIKLHSNAHFEIEDIELPDIDDLRYSFEHEFNHILRIVMKLLNS